MRINDESKSQKCENDGDVDKDMGQVASPASPFQRLSSPYGKAELSNKGENGAKHFPAVKENDGTSPPCVTKKQMRSLLGQDKEVVK